MNTWSSWFCKTPKVLVLLVNSSGLHNRVRIWDSFFLLGIRFPNQYHSKSSCFHTDLNDSCLLAFFSGQALFRASHCARKSAMSVGLETLMRANLSATGDEFILWVHKINWIIAHSLQKKEEHISLGEKNRSEKKVLREQRSRNL